MPLNELKRQLDLFEKTEVSKRPRMLINFILYNFLLVLHDVNTDLIVLYIDYKI